jgi:amino acid permease
MTMADPKEQLLQQVAARFHNHYTNNNDNDGSMPGTPDSATRGFLSRSRLLVKRQSTFWPSERDIPQLQLQRHPSLEFLVPAHDCQSRRSSPSIAIINLVATVCGGGVLSLPMAFSRAGLLPSLFLMILAAYSTNFSMYILCSCARRTGGSSYENVMRTAFGAFAGLAATVLLISLLFLVLVAYMVLLKDIWTPVLLQLVPQIQTWTQQLQQQQQQEDGSSSQIILIMILIVVLPLLLQTDLHALRHTCYIGFVSAILLLLGVSQQAFVRNWNDPNLFLNNVVWVGDRDGILYAFPIIVLSFFSIYNVLTVHSALFNPTRSRVKLVLDGTIALCFM